MIFHNHVRWFKNNNRLGGDIILLNYNSVEKYIKIIILIHGFFNFIIEVSIRASRAVSFDQSNFT